MVNKKHEDKYIHIEKKQLIRIILTLMPIAYFILFFTAMTCEQPFNNGLSVGTEIENMNIWLFQRYPLTMIWMTMSGGIAMLIVICSAAMIWDDD